MSQWRIIEACGISITNVYRTLRATFMVHTLPVPSEYDIKFEMSSATTLGGTVQLVTQAESH